MLTTKDLTEAGSPEVAGEEMGSGTIFEDENGARPLANKPAVSRRISIFGLGYVGAVSLACLARDGHRVIGVDIDPVKLELIRNRKSPILEEGIQELMRDVVNSGRVSVTNDAMQAMQESEVSFVCVGTPSASNGSQDLTAILRLAEQIGAALKLKDEFHTIVIRSTVQPGTVEDKIEPILERASGKKSGVDFGLVLSAGVPARGIFDPRLRSSAVHHRGRQLRSGGERGARSVPAPGCAIHGDEHPRGRNAQDGCNAFHALKITFANEIGRVSQSLGIDPHEVMRLVCADKRLNISPAYLKPGFAFGGSCLPKDLRALTNIAKQNDIVLPMLSSLLASNRVHIDHAVDKILKLGRPKVGMLGLSFKTGTDDLRESPLVLVAKRLLGEGCELRIFDPEVQLSRLLGANRSYIDANIPHLGELLCADIESMIDPSDVILVGLQQSALNDALQARVRPEQYLVDLVNLPNRDLLRCRYEGVCW